MAITSHVKLTYFNINNNGGIAEPLKLLLQDAGVSHEYNKIEFSEWPKKKAELDEKNVTFNTLPIVELDGKHLTATTPILRLLSKKLGKYQGSTEEEEYLVDTAADFCIDWRGEIARASFLKDEAKKYAKEAYLNGGKAKHQGRFENVYGLNDGPYILGQEISYADFMVYHNLISDGQRKKGLEEYPNLTKFIKAFEERPNLKEYTATNPEVACYDA